MKKLKLFIISLLVNFIAINVLAQNAQPYIGILASGTGTVGVGCTLDLLITVGNTGSTTIPFAKLRPNIIVPASVTFLPNAQQTGLPSGFTILSNTGAQLRFCNTSATVSGTQNITFALKVQGVTVAPFTACIAQIFFGNGTTCAAGTSVGGNNTADDFSTSSIEVISAPTLTTSASLNAFTTFSGTASAEQNFSVSGSTLSENVIITAPTDFEVSASSGSGFSNTATLLPTQLGTLTSVPVYVRLAATAPVGSPSGNVVVSLVSSTCGTPQNVAVTGTVSTAVPLTLLSFSYTLLNCKPQLIWSTTTEVNTDKFIIEKSNTNGSDWKTAGVVSASGYTASITNYSFVDVNVATSNKKVLYRLKMIDKDGSFAYSNLLAVSQRCNAVELSVFPNPISNGKLFVSLTGASEITEAQLLSITGQQLMKLLLKNGTNMIDVSQLSNGIYILNSNDINGVQQKVKIIIQQ